MNKEQFWAIIDEARQAASGWQDMYQPLVDKLSLLDDGDIFRWHQIFDMYQKLSYKDKLWAAAYVINGGCSDDGFDYFRGWLTAQGKSVFLNALRNPDSLADHLDASQEGEIELENMLGAASGAWFKKHGSPRDYDLYYEKLDAYNSIPDDEEAAIKTEIVYAEEGLDDDWADDEDLLKDIVPKLCELFNW